MYCGLLQEWRTSLQINKVLQAQSFDLGSCLVQHARREINPGYVLHLQGKAQQQVRLAELPARARFPPAVCCSACMPQRSSTWCLPRPGVTCSKWQSGAVERSGGDPAGYCTVACPKGMSEVVCREATQIGPCMLCQAIVPPSDLWLSKSACCRRVPLCRQRPVRRSPAPTFCLLYSGRLMPVPIPASSTRP